MKTVGLIVEYNPLHNGHVHHFEQSKIITGADASIAVMSGHFLQRGEPALIGKWARAEAALKMGADVVLELPVRYSTAPAEWFAYGAAALLQATGIVDALCFGSELGSLDQLNQLARALYIEPAAFRELLQEELRRGISYPAAYSSAISRFTASSELADAVEKPNNSLGLHYLIALQRLGSNIQPFTIPRTAAGYNQTDITDQTIASATAIRKLILENHPIDHVLAYIPTYMQSILDRECKDGRGPNHWESFAAPLLYQLITSSAAELANYDEVDEGLEHRILSALSHMKSDPFSVSLLLDAIKTKRYTRTKLQRTLLRILLRQRSSGYTRDQLQQGPTCIRVLGFTNRGRMLLNRMKKQATLPILTQINRSNAHLIEEDIQATAVYTIAHRQPDLWQAKRDYYQAPIQL
jgi:predicted nucleotidyltransferase